MKQLFRSNLLYSEERVFEANSLDLNHFLGFYQLNQSLPQFPRIDNITLFRVKWFNALVNQKWRESDSPINVHGLLPSVLKCHSWQWWGTMQYLVLNQCLLHAKQASKPLFFLSRPIKCLTFMAIITKNIILKRVNFVFWYLRNVISCQCSSPSL